MTAITSDVAIVLSTPLDLLSVMRHLSLIYWVPWF
jgi:hypothetical protein